MNELRQSVTLAAQEEKTRCDNTHGLFISPHEAYGVLAEEMLEQDDEHAAMRFAYNQILDAIHSGRNRQLRGLLHSISTSALQCAAESIQVAAVCERFLDYLHDKEG